MMKVRSVILAVQTVFLESIFWWGEGAPPHDNLESTLLRLAFEWCLPRPLLLVRNSSISIFSVLADGRLAAV